MAESNIQPNTILIERVRNGIATIRVRWDITSEQKSDDVGSIYTSWTYEECMMKWVLPQVYESLNDVQTYLDSNYSDGETIVDWAKASKLDYSGVE